MRSKIQKQFQDRGLELNSKVLDKCMRSLSIFFSFVFCNFTDLSSILELICFFDYFDYIYILIFYLGVELCSSYHLSDELDFIELWTSYSASNLNGAQPSVLLLLEFERKVLQAKKDKRNLTPSLVRRQSLQQDPCSSMSLKCTSENDVFIGHEADEDLMDAYIPLPLKASNEQQDDFVECLTPKVSE